MKIKLDELASLIYHVENNKKINPSEKIFMDLPFHRKLTYRAKALIWYEIFQILKEMYF